MFFEKKMEYVRDKKVKNTKIFEKLPQKQEGHILDQIIRPVTVKIWHQL